MSPAHPLDPVLAQLDPPTNRITAEDIAALGDGEHLNITLLTTSTKPLMALDLRMFRADRDRVRLEPTPNCPPNLVPILIGVGIQDDGSMKSHSIGATPCRCPRAGTDGRHWNPLSVALLWHDRLVPQVSTIFTQWLATIRQTPERYCEDGLMVLTALVKAQSR